MQALTIIGLGTAYTNIRLMLFAIWPFGQAIRDQVSPGPDHGQMQRRLCNSYADSPLILTCAAPRLQSHLLHTMHDAEMIA